MEEEKISERVRVRRHPERGHYDRGVIDAILDEGLVCSVAFTRDGLPCVLPSNYVRIGDHLYLHGGPESTMFRTLAQGVPVCVCVTLVDGLVLSRSAANHSMNYRSVVVYGESEEVTDLQEKRATLTALVDQIVPGRSREVRPPEDRSLERTCVVRVPLRESSAKVHSGPPGDPQEDADVPVWAGVLPLALLGEEPVPDPDMPPIVPVPPTLRHYRRSAGRQG